MGVISCIKTIIAWDPLGRHGYLWNVAIFLVFCSDIFRCISLHFAAFRGSVALSVTPLLVLHRVTQPQNALKCSETCQNKTLERSPCFAGTCVALVESGPIAYSSEPLWSRSSTAYHKTPWHKPYHRTLFDRLNPPCLFHLWVFLASHLSQSCLVSPHFFPTFLLKDNYGEGLLHKI